MLTEILPIIDKTYIFHSDLNSHPNDILWSIQWYWVNVVRRELYWWI